MNNTLHFFGKDPKETKGKGKRDTSLKYFYGALFYFFFGQKPCNSFLAGLFCHKQNDLY